LFSVCSAHTTIFLLRSCSSTSVRSSGCFPAQGLVFPVDFWFWFYNLARPDFLRLSHLCVDAARVLCIGPFFLANVSCSGIPVPASRCTERFTDLYFSFDFQSSYSSNRSKHLVDSVCSSVSIASHPSPIVFPARFAPARRCLCLLSSARLWFSSVQNPFPNCVLDDFSILSSEPMRRPGARVLELGLHDRLLVQIQLLCLRSTFGLEFLL
jgi:hypothetical protein